MILRSLCIVPLLALAACGGRARAQPQPADAAASGPRHVVLDPGALARLGVATHPAGEQGARATIALPGSIEYDLDRYAEVGPRLEGRVTSIKAKLGDRVRRGDVLAEVSVPTLADAQAASLTASAALAAAAKNAEREDALFAQSLTTAREVEMARAEAARAKAEVDAAKARLDALGAGARRIGGHLALVAPIDGTIVQRTAVLGGFLATSQSAFVIADTSQLMAQLDVHEADLPYVRVDSDVTFTADSLPGRSFEGRLTYVDPTVSRATRLVRARAAIRNDEGALRPGMFIRATAPIPTALARGAIALPPEAVQPLGSDDVVFVERAPGDFEIRTVRVGRRTSEVVEIDEGVARGERVVVEGAFLIRGEAAKQ